MGKSWRIRPYSEMETLYWRGNRGGSTALAPKSLGVIEFREIRPCLALHAV